MHGAAKPNMASRPSHAPQPVYIAGALAWLHRPGPDWGGETAVLICSALNQDALDSHRFLRVLADAFAAAGYPALRFDYPDTGDSCDLAECPAAFGNAWLAWQHSLQAAAEYLQASTGAKRLILCGLRIGATLAALAAEGRADVSGLILLAPVIRGQSFIRQLWVESRLKEGNNALLENGFTFQGLTFSAQAVQSIAQADLRAVKMAPGRHIAICAQSPTLPLAACEHAWKQQGANLWSADFSGLSPLLNHKQETDIPAADFSKLLAWAKQHIPPRPTFQLGGVPPGRVPGGTPTSTSRLSRVGLVETPFGFGPKDGIFGMLCQPETGDTDIAVILCGPGINPHYGVARSTVRLARHLAEAGIASLRIDFAGLGDSAGPPGRETAITGPFEVRVPEIKAAIDRLQALGYRRFAVQGICSGAFHAYHAALADPRIGALLLLNIPLFQEADAAEAGAVMHAAAPWHYYLERLTYSRTWIRWMSGRSNVSGVLRGRLRRLLGGGLALKSVDFTRSAITRLSRRGVTMVFLFGLDEVGFYALEDAFGPQGRDLRKLDHVTLEVIPSFDHITCLPEAQKDATRAVLSNLLSWREGACA